MMRKRHTVRRPEQSLDRQPGPVDFEVCEHILQRFYWMKHQVFVAHHMAIGPALPPLGHEYLYFTNSVLDIFLNIYSCASANKRLAAAKHVAKVPNKEKLLCPFIELNKRRCHQRTDEHFF